jgi:membrane protease YdiL (CAAX protease family)
MDRFSKFGKNRAVNGPGETSGAEPGGAIPPADAVSTGRPEDPLGEVLLAWAGALGLIWLIAQALSREATEMVQALVWAAIPIGLALARRRPLLEEGIAWRSPRRTWGFVAIYALVFLPLYAAGFFAWVRAHPAPPDAVWRMPAPDVPLWAFVASLAYAALPEEVFFRGFVQPRLARLWPEDRARRVAGIPLTRAVVAAAALFAVTHVAFLPPAALLSTAALERLTTFFPGLLFGALREETGDVVAPALFHALCNAWLYTLQHGYLT